MRTMTDNVIKLTDSLDKVATLVSRQTTASHETQKMICNVMTLQQEV